MLHKLIKAALILDPNKYQAQLLSQALQAAGVGSVKIYATAAEARDALDLLGPCVVFVDADLPDGDGVSFARAFRRSLTARNRKAPLVLTAQGASTLTVSQASDAGANALLVKPIAPAQAIGAVKRMLENPRAFIDAPSYVGPCRRYGVAPAPQPCPRRRAEDKALERLEHLALRDETIAALVRMGDAACAGDDQARALCETKARALSDLAMLLHDPIMRTTAEMIARVLSDETHAALRAQGAVLFQALALLVETAPDDPKRMQMEYLLESVAA